VNANLRDSPLLNGQRTDDLRGTGGEGRNARRK